MSPTSLFSKSDKEHLNSIALTINWALVARVMRALNWRWYNITGRTPNAGELRDTAMQYITTCIQEARQSPHHRASMSTGHFCYEADVCPETGDVLRLRCEFVLEAHESTEPTSCDSNTYPE